MYSLCIIINWHTHCSTHYLRVTQRQGDWSPPQLEGENATSASERLSSDTGMTSHDSSWRVMTSLKSGSCTEHLLCLCESVQSQPFRFACSDLNWNTEDDAAGAKKTTSIFILELPKGWLFALLTWHGKLRSWNALECSGSAAAGHGSLSGACQCCRNLEPF